MTQKSFTFWKENRISQEYVLTLNELKEKFIDYMKSKEKDWLKYYCMSLVPNFIRMPDGLNSVTESPFIEGEITKFLNPIKWDYLESIGIK